MIDLQRKVDELVKAKMFKMEVRVDSGLGSLCGVAGIVGYKEVASKPMGFKPVSYSNGSVVGLKPMVTQVSLGRKDKASGPIVGLKSLVGPKPKVSVLPIFTHNGKGPMFGFKPTIPSVTMQSDLGLSVLP